MIINLSELLPAILYILLIVLVIILIILGIKLIKTINKIDTIIDDVNVKMDKVNGVFDLIDRTTDYAASISDKVIDGITNFLYLIFKRKKGKSEENGEEI